MSPHWRHGQPRETPVGGRVRTNRAQRRGPSPREGPGLSPREVAFESGLENKVHQVELVAGMAFRQSEQNGQRPRGQREQGVFRKQ